MTRRKLVPCTCSVGNHYIGTTAWANCQNPKRGGQSVTPAGRDRYATTPSGAQTASEDSPTWADLNVPVLLAQRFSASGLTPTDVREVYAATGVTADTTPDDVPDDIIAIGVGYRIEDTHGEELVWRIEDTVSRYDNLDTDYGRAMSSEMTVVARGIGHLPSSLDWEQDPESVEYQEFKAAMEQMEGRNDEVQRETLAGLAPLIAPRCAAESALVKKTGGRAPKGMNKQEWLRRLGTIEAGCRAAQALRPHDTYQIDFNNPRLVLNVASARVALAETVQAGANLLPENFQMI